MPRSLNFNPDVPSGASWIREQPQRNSTQVDYIDMYFEKRTEACLAIDELVEAVVTKLSDLGLLGHTYVVYVSDNGFSLGQHRRYPGKSLGYEEDIRVPFYIRGPGIKKGSSDASPFNVADLSTTMLHIAGASSEIDVDGRIMTWGLDGASKKQVGSKSHHVSEYWETGNSTCGPVYPSLESRLIFRFQFQLFPVHLEKEMPRRVTLYTGLSESSKTIRTGPTSYGVPASGSCTT